MQRPNAPLIQKAKSIWEKLRLKKITKEESEKLMDKMMTVITGKCQEVRLDTCKWILPLVKSSNSLDHFQA